MSARRSSGPQAAAREPRRRGRRHPWLRLLLVVVVVVVATQWLLDPWSIHIGGRFTPWGTWTAYGEITASNGGRYELWLDAQGGGFATISGLGKRCSGRGCVNLIGTAELCGSNGVVERFSFDGTIGAFMTLSTEGAPTGLLLSGGSPAALPEGDRLAFSGTWSGPVLNLTDPDGAFTENVAPDGSIRTTTTTADAGTASVALAPGDHAGFVRACANLRG